MACKPPAGKSNLPPCPMCKTNRHANARAGGDFYCSNCRGLYDGRDDDGGDYSDRNPAARLERAERERERRRR
jgi:hypothetical protein